MGCAPCCQKPAHLRIGFGVRILPIIDCPAPCPADNTLIRAARFFYVIAQGSLGHSIQGVVNNPSIGYQPYQP